MHRCVLVIKKKRVEPTLWRGCERHKEGRDVLEGMKKIDECDMEKCSSLRNIDKTIDMPGNRWWPQKPNKEGNGIGRKLHVRYGLHIMCALMFGVYLSGVDTVLQLERDACHWSNDRGKQLNE